MRRVCWVHAYNSIAHTSQETRDIHPHAASLLGERRKQWTNWQLISYSQTIR